MPPDAPQREPVCRNCGLVESRHIFAVTDETDDYWDFTHICPTSVFQPEEESPDAAEE